MIDQMTFPRLEALRRAWARVPPLAVTLARLASYVGVPAPKLASADAAGSRRITSKEEILAAFGSQGFNFIGARPVDPGLDLCGY